MTTINKTIAAMKNIPTEEELNILLRSSVLEITFTKLDGDTRTMTCTKNFDVIPESSRPKTNKVSKAGIINVWDLDANAWRSFHYGRVLAIQPVVV